MVSKEFYKNIDLIVEEKGISREQVLEASRKALIQAYKKTYGNASVRVEFNEGKNEILMYSEHVVVEKYSENLEDGKMAEILLEDAKKVKPSIKVGDVLVRSVSPKDFGRTSASSGKQTLNQTIKQDQKDNAYAHYKDLEGEMIVAIVTAVSEDYITLKIDNDIIASLPKKEKLPNDSFVVGDRIKVYLSAVEQTPRGPKLYVSRNDKNLVTRLMEMNIPEIKEGIIEIRGIARDAGDRSKVAIKSNNDNVDPIGACIGEKGSRINAIVEALNGEKIDLYKYSDDPKELIQNSLQPATVIDVINIDVKNGTSVAIVPDSQLSLAIGKHGQNVRLAVQSCGWKIDIKSESEAKESGIKF